MPDEENPRYRGSGPPSLEQLRALLLNATVESVRSPDGKYSEIRFKVDNVKLHESGHSYFGTDSQIYAGFLGILDRITEFEDITKRHADNITGVTCDDMISQFQREIKHVSTSGGLTAILLRAMFENAIKKMEELKEWRRAADAKRREKEQAAREDMRKERERREREAEALRKQQRREAEYAKRQREKAERVDPGAKSRTHEEAFGADFAEAFGMGEEEFKEWARHFQQQYRYRHQQRHWQQQEQAREQARPKARNKSRAPWYEVLGVPATASKDEIRKAYRRLASKYHPDRYKEADANERMADINTARDEGLR